MNECAGCSQDIDMIRRFAWATGVFDAEGQLRIHKGSFQMRIRSADRPMLDRFAEVVGGHVCGPYGNGTRTNGEAARGIFEWYLPASEVAEVVELMLPLLSPRQRDRAAEILAKKRATLSVVQ